MTIFSSFLALTLLVVPSLSLLYCQKQTPSLTLDRDTTNQLDYGGISWRSLLPCGLVEDRHACHSTLFEGTYTRSDEDSVSYSYTSETKGCTWAKVCNRLAGDTDACQYAQYTHEKWRPTSCDASQDYNAITQSHDVKVSVACCTDSNYCNAAEDYSRCTEATEFSNYLQRANTCWNTYKKTFMQDLLCDSDRGDILTWGEDCTNPDGTWKRRSDVLCPYRATCTDELRSLLKDFGECACTAATDNGFTGNFIGTALEENWKRWCPGIELSCSDDGVVEVLYRYYYIRYRFRLAVAAGLVDATTIAAIRARISAKLNVHEDSITIEASSDTSTSTRRLLQDESSWTVTITAESESDKNYFLTQIDSTLSSSIASDTGIATTEEGVEEEEGEASTEGKYSNNSSDANYVKINFGIFAVLFALFAYFQ